MSIIGMVSIVFLYFSRMSEIFIVLSPQKKNCGLIMVTLFSDFVACEGQANVSSVAGKESVWISQSSVSVVCMCGESVNVLKPLLTCFYRFLQTTLTTSETRLERSLLE